MEKGPDTMHHGEGQSTSQWGFDEPGNLDHAVELTPSDFDLDFGTDTTSAPSVEPAPNAEPIPTIDSAEFADPAEFVDVEPPVSLDNFFAIRMNLDEDKRDAARDYAEHTVNDEATHEHNFFKKLWKGTLAKKYYERRYAREILSGEREVKDADGEFRSLDDIFAKNRTAALERFRRGIIENLDLEAQGLKLESAYIHKKAGEDSHVDHYATTIVKGAIKEFVEDNQEAYLGGATDLKSLAVKFDEYLGRHQAEARDRGKPVNEADYGEYAKAAIEALKLSAHSGGIDNVIEGFRVYEAKIKDGTRTEAHRNALASVLDWTESHTNVPIVALDVVAAAAGAATAVAQSAARRALGIFGLLVPTLFSGLKEYNRITNDRTRMLRDAETGTTYEYQGFSGEQLENAGLKGSEKKRAKYEAKLGTTLYETVPVSKLLEEISNAKENGDRRALLVALATARSSVDYADFEKKGIISYTPGKMGDERLALDIAMIETEKSLSQEELKEYHELCDQTDANIDKKVSNKDKAFNRVRLIKSLKKSGRTLAFGAIGFLAGQEISAARDPAKIGLFEKYGPFKTSNNFNASETFLAKGAGHFETFFGGPNANGVYTGSTGEISQFNINVNGNNQAVMRDLEARGYTKTKLSSGSVSFREVPRPDSVAPAGSAFDRTVQYDGWARGATTSQVYLNNGQFSSGITGGINGAGQNLNYADLASAGRIKGYLTIGGAKLEVVASTNAAGQLTWGENGVFNIIAPDGTESTIKAISDSGEKLYKYFEVAVDNGVDADGIQHLIPLATDVGRNNFDGTIEQLTTLYEMVEHPDVYAFTKVIQRSSTFSRELDTSGILSLAAVNDLFQGRTNLGPATSQSTPNVV